MAHYGYVRVSTKKQAEGPEAQRQAIRAWAEREGVLIAGWFEEQVSGGASLDNRPAIVAAQVACTRGDVLVAARRDRLGRDVFKVALLKQIFDRAGVEIRTLDGPYKPDTPEGILHCGIIDLFAEYERAVIRLRTKAAMEVKKRRGDKMGTAPFGWRKEPGIMDRHLPDTKEQAALERMRELKNDGLTYEKIAERLGIEGFEPRGKRWHRTTVCRALRRT